MKALHYGNISPADKSFKWGSEYSQPLHLAAWNEEKLSVALTQEQKIIFEKFNDCTMDMCGIAEKDAFVAGTKLGIKIVIETYTDSSFEFNEI